MANTPSVLLVPVDGSQGACAAAEYASAFASALGIPVRLLFAFPENPVDMFGTPTDVRNLRDLRYFDPDAFARLRDDSAAQAFGTARKAMGETNVTVEEEVLAGHAAEAIVTHANETPDAMILMGSRGLNAVQETLLGSVSQRILHRAKCPVTIIH
ncbi:universal stress protein [Arhodomonas sp. AD133]|uniref:universal stress protein n=1 Tax=Arhodomonas sp. AD133 TaxID=3415009 RepID=UPI003EB7E0D1